MGYNKDESVAEALLFKEVVLRQCEYFYQYMHGERKELNEAVTIFKKVIELFDTRVDFSKGRHRCMSLICD